MQGKPSRKPAHPRSPTKAPPDGTKVARPKVRRTWCADGRTPSASCAHPNRDAWVRPVLV